MTLVRFMISLGSLGFIVPGKTTVTIQQNTDPALPESGWLSVQNSINPSNNPGHRGATLPVTVTETGPEGKDVVKGVAYRAVIL